MAQVRDRAVVLYAGRIVIFTHDLPTAALFADQIAVMYLGRIVESGPARELVHNPQPATRALLSLAPAGLRNAAPQRAGAHR